jgi:PIN domain nuclease of toxin-antitoxin system
VFESAEQGDGNGLIYIPTVVLAEALLLVQSGHVSITPPFDEWVRELSRKTFFPILDLTTEVILKAFRMQVIADPFDRLIAATALEHDFPLITLDDKITRSRLVECLWDE